MATNKADVLTADRKVYQSTRKGVCFITRSNAPTAWA